jgi:hypothetical protein
MDLSKLRAITNNYQDAHLISLKNWKRAGEVVPRDQGGPYMISQEGYDPQDALVRPNEFVLGRSGKWSSLSVFFKLPAAARRDEFVFGSAAEVITLLDSLPPKAAVARGEPAAAPTDEPGDDLQSAYLEAKDTASPSTKLT